MRHLMESSQQLQEKPRNSLDAGKGQQVQDQLSEVLLSFFSLMHDAQ